MGTVTDLELDSDEGLDLRKQCEEGGLNIDLEHVDFTYPGNDKLVLQDINLNIKAGDKVLLTGPNGSGKSTLLQVIAGLYDPKGGVIRYQGLTKSSLNLNSVRDVISDVFGFEELFYGTVFENISLGRSSVSEDEILDICQRLGLKEFISALPKGHNSIIDPQGKKLPSGIRAKLLLARALVGNPRLIVLEYAFEHINRKERSEIIQYILEHKQDCTIVACSKDMELSKMVDQVVVMEEGKILTAGPVNEMESYLKEEEYA